MATSDRPPPLLVILQRWKSHRQLFRPDWGSSVWRALVSATSETLVVSTRVNINGGRLSHKLDLRGIVERSVHCSKPLQRPGRARLNKG